MKQVGLVDTYQLEHLKTMMILDAKDQQLNPSFEAQKSVIKFKGKEVFHLALTKFKKSASFV